MPLISLRQPGAFLSYQRSTVLIRCLVLTHTTGREPPGRCVADPNTCGGNLRVIWVARRRGTRRARIAINY
jgi:hypothetical protein